MLLNPTKAPFLSQALQERLSKEALSVSCRTACKEAVLMQLLKQLHAMRGGSTLSSALLDSVASEPIAPSLKPIR